LQGLLLTPTFRWVQQTPAKLRNRFNGFSHCSPTISLNPKTVETVPSRSRRLLTHLKVGVNEN
jgi:hypothetical protein